MADRRYAVTAQQLVSTLPPASRLPTGVAKIVDGNTFVVRSGRWVQVVDATQVGGTGPVPDQAPAEDVVRTTGTSINLSYSRPQDFAPVAALDCHGLSQGFSAETEALGPPVAFSANGFGMRVGRGGTYQLGLVLDQLLGCPAGTKFQVIATVRGVQYVLLQHEHTSQDPTRDHSVAPASYRGLNPVVALLPDDQVRLDIRFLGAADAAHAPLYASMTLTMSPLVLEEDSTIDPVSGYWYSSGGENWIYDPDYGGWKGRHVVFSGSQLGTRCRARVAYALTETQAAVPATSLPGTATPRIVTAHPVDTDWVELTYNGAEWFGDVLFHLDGFALSGDTVDMLIVAQFLSGDEVFAVNSYGLYGPVILDV